MGQFAGKGSIPAIQELPILVLNPWNATRKRETIVDVGQSAGKSSNPTFPSLCWKMGKERGYGVVFRERLSSCYPRAFWEMRPSPSREEFVGFQRGSKGCPDPAGSPRGRGRALNPTGIRRFWDLSGKKSHFSISSRGWRNLPAQGNLRETFVGEIQSFFQHHSRSTQDFPPWIRA